MTLKAVIENEEDIPENLREFYVEKDGKWYLDVDDTIKQHPTIVPLANSLDNLKKDKKKLNDQLAEARAAAARAEGLPEDFDLDEFKRLTEEEARRKADPNYKPQGGEELLRMREQYDNRIRGLEKRYNDDIAAREAQIQERDSRLQRRVAGEELTKALVSIGVGREFLEAAHAFHRSSVRIVDVEGEPKAVVETDLGEVPLAQYIENWGKSEAGKPFVKAPVGGGAPGSERRSSEPNPFSDAHWNVTEQGNVVKTKGLEVAERLAKSAGTTVGGPRPIRRRDAA